MSFGFGVGDFLAVIALAKKVQEDFRNAPQAFAAISDEVKSLTVLLSQVEKDFAGHEGELQDEAGLQTVLHGANVTLHEVESFVDKNSKLATGQQAHPRDRLKRIWGRFKFDPYEVNSLRSRLLSNITLLEGLTQHLDRLETRQKQASLEQRYENQDRQELLDWISKDAMAHKKRFTSLKQRREPGTRKWLFESPEWREWIQPGTGGTTLYCPGIPGAGKTFTAAMAIERLYESSRAHYSNVGIAYVFCDYQRSADAKEKEYLNLAKTLLRMLIEQTQSRDWPDVLIRAYEKHRRSPSESELGIEATFELLKVVVSNLQSSTFVIIDALDELTNSRRQLLSLLIDLQRSTGLNLFFTFRDVEDIDTIIRRKCSRAIKKSIQATEEDVERFLSTEIAKMENSLIINHPQLQAEVKNKITRAAGEMFLLADLHLRSIQSCGSVTAVRRILADLSSNPASANKAFESTMKRIQEQGGEPESKAMQALMVLTFSRRPLTVNELRYALAVDLAFPEDGVDEENLYSIDYIKSCCAGLVAVQTSNPIFQTPPSEETAASVAHKHHLNGDNIVQLAHKSIRDYLSSESKWFTKPQSRMVLICKAFLEDGRSQREENQPQTTKSYPFLTYARDHWGSHHAEAVLEHGTVEHGILSKRQVSSNPLDERAVFEFGFRQLANELTDMRELFLWACREGRLNIIELLLTINPGAFMKPGTQEVTDESDVLQTRCGCKSCAANGQYIVVLPRKTASTSIDDDTEECLRERRGSSMIDDGVVSAAHNGKTQTIKFLMKRGATLGGRDVDGFTPLGAAAWAGHAETLAWLLDLELTGVRDVQRIQFWSFQYELPGDGKINWPAIPQDSIPGGYRRYPKQKCLAMTSLSVAAYHGHGRCVDVLMSWMKPHKKKISQQTWKNGKMSSRASDEDSDACDSRSLLDQWTSDCMASMICVMGQNHAHANVLYHLLAHVDILEFIPGFDHTSLLDIAVEIQCEAEASTQPRVADQTNMLHPSVGIYERNDPITENEAAESDQHCDLIAARIWNSKDGPQSQADILLFEAITCQGSNSLEKYFVSLSTSTDDARYTIFHRILLRIGDKSRKWCLEAAYHGLTFMDPGFDVDPFELVADNRYSSEGRVNSRSRCYCLSEYAVRLVRGDAVLTRGLIDRKGISAATFHLLMAIGTTRPLQEALRMFPQLAREKDARGRTALMAAATSQSTSVLRIILRALETIDEDTSSFINKVSGDGLSVFSYATYGIDSHSAVDFIIEELLNTPGVDPLLLFHKTRILPFHDFYYREGDERTRNEWRPFTTYLAIPVDADRKLDHGLVLDLMFKTLLAHPDRPKVSRLIMECFVDDPSSRVYQSRSIFSGSQLLAQICGASGAKCLQSLLQCCPDLEPLLHLPDSNGMTMLCHASLAFIDTKNTTPDTVDFLLNTLKFDPKFSDERGRTAMSRLAKKLFPTLYPRRPYIFMKSLTPAIDTAALLVKSGADPLAEDDEGFSALSYAITGCPFEISKWIDGEYHDIKVHGGIFEGSIFYRLLYDESTPLEEVEGRGEKLLDLALAAGNHEAVRLLVKRSGRAGFWLNRSKLRASRRFSCDFYPPVEFDDGSDGGSQVSTENGDDSSVASGDDSSAESEDGLPMDARSDIGIGNDGDDAKELSLGSRTHFSAGGVAVSDLMLLPTFRSHF